MRLHPRRRRIERGSDNVRQERSAGADENELAREIGKIGVGLEDFPGRDRTAGVGLCEPDAKSAVGLRGNDDVTDLERLDTDALAGGLSEFARGLHHSWRRPDRAAASP